MSIRAKITSGVNTAFNKLGDLVVSAVFTQESVSGYNFSTGISTKTSNASKTVNLIVVGESSSTEEGHDVDAIVKSGLDVSTYDTATFNLETYKVSGFEDNGFIIELKLSKES